MADVALTFRGQDVGAVSTTKSVDDALGELATQCLQTQAALREALDGVNGDPAEAEIRKVKNELEATSTQAVATKTLLATLFSGFDTTGPTGQLALLAGGIGGVMGSMALFGSAFGDLKLPAFWAGFDLGVQAVGALGAALIALVAAISPVSGALLALPGAMTALAQGALVLKLGFDGIGDALKAGAAAAEENIVANTALVAAQDRVRVATDQLKNAKDALTAAQQTAKTAQESLSAARRDAAQAIDDLYLRLRGAELSEREAKLALIEAEQALNAILQDSTATKAEVEAAILRVERAELNLDVAQQTRKQTEAELNQAELLGVERSPQVLAAKDALKAAEENVKTAQDNVKTATDAVGVATDAMRAIMAQTTPEVQKFGDAMAKLSPSAQEFVNQILALKPRLDELKTIASENLFQGINDGLRLASTDANWDALKSIVGSTSTVLGNLARDLGQMFADPQWSRDLQAIGEQNARVLDTLGQAFLNLLPAFRDLVVAAGPFVQWLADGVLHFTDWVANAIAAGRESGALAGFLDRTREAMQLLWDIAKPLGQVFLDIGAAAAPLGREILRDLGIELDKLAQWTGSVAGQAALRKYFEDAKPAIYEAGRLLRDVVAALLALSANEPGGGAITEFMNRLRTEVLPIFKATADGAGQAFGPAIADLIIELLRLFGLLTGPSGPLTTLVEQMSNVVGAINDFLVQHPELTNLIATLMGLVTWAKLLAATGIISFLVTLTAGLVGMVAPTLAARVGFEGLNATMRANPIGAIITAIQLLVAAVIVAYTQSETFRKFVDALWAAIQTAVSWTIEFVKQVWALIEPFRYFLPVVGPAIAVIENFPAILGAASSAAQALISAFNAVIDFFRNNWPIVATLLAGPFAPIVALATDAFGIRSAIVNSIQGVKTAATNLGNAIFDGIVNGITGVATEVALFLNRIIKDIRDRVSVWLADAKKLGKAIFDGIKNGVTGIANEVGRILTNVINAVGGFVTRAAQAGARVGRAIAAGIRNAFSGIATTIATLIRGAINGALRIVNAAIGAINAALAFSINVPDIIPGLPNVIEFNPPNIPTIPYLAQGGIVTGPTLAVLGEAGPEAVVPLDQYNSGPTINVSAPVGGSVVAERDLVKAITDGIILTLRRNPGALGAAGLPR